MSFKKWKILETHTLFKNQWFDIKEEKVQVSEELALEGVIVHHFRDWVNIVPLTHDHHIILENQYRHGVGAITVETPSGSMEEEDQSPKDAAARELYEETGYAAGKMIFLGRSQANPQLMNNFIHHFLALDCHLVDRPKPEIGGVIDFWLEPFEKALEKINRGEILHSYVIEGLLRAKEWLQNRPPMV